MRRATRLAAVLGAIAIVTATSATGAYAESITNKDAHGDVLLEGYTTGIAGSAHAHRVERGVDITALRLNYGTSYVTVKVTFSHLLTRHIDIPVLIDTDAADERVFYTLIMPTRSTDNFVIVKENYGSNPDDRVCGPRSVAPGPKFNVKTRVEYGTAGSVEVYVPRFCLGYPGKVRAMAGAKYDDGTGLYTDDVPTNHAGLWKWTRFVHRD